MYRLRTRPKYSDVELAELYRVPHVHTKWEDHVHRVDRTIEVGKQFWAEYADPPGELPCIADLSCGDAAIAEGLAEHACLQLGDFAPGYEHQGPIEETIDQLDHPVDIFICSETIEHLDRPDDVLKQIRQKSRLLLLSTPWCQWPDPNPEHYHSWDDEAVRDMLVAADWNPVYYERYYTGLGYHYQIWFCE